MSMTQDPRAITWERPPHPPMLIIDEMIRKDRVSVKSKDGVWRRIVHEPQWNLFTNGYYGLDPYMCVVPCYCKRKPPKVGDMSELCLPTNKMMYERVLVRSFEIVIQRAPVIRCDLLLAVGVCLACGCVYWWGPQELEALVKAMT